MVDRHSGRTLWKKWGGLFNAGFKVRMKPPAPLEELQLDNQRRLKEALNKMMEELVAKIKKQCAKSKL